MRDDDKIRCLVEVIFGKNTNPREDTACLQADEFLQSLRIVVVATGVTVNSRFGGFDVLLSEISSDERYVSLVMYVCLLEYEYNQSKLKRFINLCTLVKLASDKMLQIRGVDYSDLNSDIIMTLYNDKMRKSIQRCGGFQKLYRYIHDHKYTKWRWSEIDMDLINSLNDLAEIINDLQKDLDGKLLKQIKEEKYLISGRSININKIKWKAYHLTKLVLLTTLVRLPIIPSQLDATDKLVKSQQHEKTEITLRTQTDAEDATATSCLNSISLVNQELETEKDFISGLDYDTSEVYDENSHFASVELPTTASKFPIVTNDSHELNKVVESDQNETAEKAEETNRTASAPKHATSEVPSVEYSISNSITYHEEDIVVQFENIIKEVIKYNGSKGSNHVNCNNPIQSEIHSVIDRMKETVKSLIEVLEEE